MATADTGPVGGLTGTRLQQIHALWEALLGQDYSRCRPNGRPYWGKATADTGPVGGLTGARLQQIQAQWQALLGQDYSRCRPCGRPDWDKTTADAGPLGGLTGTRLQQMQALWEALLRQDYSRCRPFGRPYWDKTTADAGPVGGLTGTRLQQMQDLWEALLGQDYSRCRTFGRPYWDKTTADAGPVGGLTGAWLSLGGLVGTRLQQMQEWCYISSTCTASVCTSVPVQAYCSQLDMLGKMETYWANRLTFGHKVTDLLCFSLWRLGDGAGVETHWPVLLARSPWAPTGLPHRGNVFEGGAGWTGWCVSLSYWLRFH